MLRRPREAEGSPWWMPRSRAALPARRRRRSRSWLAATMTPSSARGRCWERWAKLSTMLAEKLGLEAQKLFDISSKSSGQCWSMTSYCPVPGLVPTSPANRDYKAGFTAAMMLKDLKLAQAAARATHASTPLGAGAAAVYEQFVETGEGGVDFSGIIRFLR